MTKEIVLATTNKNKVGEIKEMFSQNKKTKDIKIFSLADIGFFDDIAETGTTFEENALQKASAVQNFLQKKGLKYAILTDDSGLCVDALDGAPGIYSARFAGEHGNDQKNRQKLLDELAGEQNRDAKYVCAMILMQPDGKYISVRGETKGRILQKITGDTTFCYDCLFYSYDLNKCFGECTIVEKNSVSHRGRAIQNLIEKL